MTRLAHFISFISLIIFAISCSTGCRFTANQPTQPQPDKTPGVPAEPELDGPELYRGPTGLSNRVFNNCIRVRTRGGAGSASVIGETDDEYILETNHHVSSRGTDNQLDIFIDGFQVQTVKARTTQSWYHPKRSVDIAEIRIKKSELGGPLSVVSMAPPGYVEANLSAGSVIYTHGCSNARWPRARFGNIIEIRNGIIFYEPEAIPGDSGSAVYFWDPVLGEIVIGRTAWTTDRNGRKMGMAMTSDRVRAIRRGEVSEQDMLPADAEEIKPHPLDPSDWDAGREVLLRRWRATWEDTDGHNAANDRSRDPNDPNRQARPIRRLGLLDGLVNPGGMNLRVGVGFAAVIIGLGVGVSVVMFTMHVLRK